MVECRTRTGSNLNFVTVSKFGHFCRTNAYKAIGSGGNNLSSLVIAAWLQCFPEKSSWCGMNRSVRGGGQK